MNGFSILMFLFATTTLLMGFYMFRGEGHEVSMLTWKAAYKNLKNSQWKEIGKWTMISSIFIYIIAILGLLFDIK